MHATEPTTAVPSTSATLTTVAPIVPRSTELRQKRLAELRPPADPSVTSLYVGGVPPNATTKDLLPYFLAYGDVKDISLDGNKLSAIVTYHRCAHSPARIVLAD